MPYRKTTAFIERLIAEAPTECVMWPFARGGDGRGRVGLEGETLAHRAVLRLAVGPPPSDRPLARHSCGRGHLGCVTPAHLSWATASENQMDRVDHGTSNRGESHGLHKLTEAEVLDAYRRAWAGENQTSIAADLGVGQHEISRIKNGRRWAWLTGHEQEAA